MKEVKSPKKPLIYYYAIVLLVLMVFNSLILPLIAKRQIKEVDYGTFMDMIDERDIGMVQVEDSQILFTDHDRKGRDRQGGDRKQPDPVYR